MSDDISDKIIEMNRLSKDDSDDDLEVEVDEKDLTERDNDDSLKRYERHLQQATEDEYQSDEEEEEVEDNVFKRHYGNHIVFFVANGDPIITIGPQWYMNICMIVTFLLSSYVLITKFALRNGSYAYYAAILLSILQILSYLTCSLLNPGIVSSKSYPTGEDAENFICKTCQTRIQESNTIHCEDCDVCIEGYDHHCPWTGKCIGKGNIYFFYLFVVILPIYIVFFIVCAAKV